MERCLRFCLSTCRGAAECTFLAKPTLQECMIIFYIVNYVLLIRFMVSGSGSFCIKPRPRRHKAVVINLVLLLRPWYATTFNRWSSVQPQVNTDHKQNDLKSFQAPEKGSAPNTKPYCRSAFKNAQKAQPLYNPY